jgi:hypothetical protein
MPPWLQRLKSQLAWLTGDTSSFLPQETWSFKVLWQQPRATHQSKVDDVVSRLQEAFVVFL